ncbi:MAG: cation:proton antiporter [Anaerolineales bacterium]|nr:cation:proton antiporter [Anaerolineales bacterium]
METNPFIALLLITGLALAVPIFLGQFRRVQVPIVVGEIFAGILIGRSGLNLVTASASLDFLAEFGFAFLMFLSGLEIDFSLILTTRLDPAEQVWKKPLPLSLLVFTGTLLLALLASALLQQLNLIEDLVLVSLILSTTSLGIVVPVLKEKKLFSEEYGQYLLVSATVADFATLLLLAVVIAIRSTGLTLDLLLVPVLLMLFVLSARLVRRIAARPLIRRALDELSSATSQIRVRGAFALMVAWVVLAESLGVELILGAFLAGAIAGLISQDNESAREKLDAIGYGFFIPIFFIMVGVEFDLSILINSPDAFVLVPLLTIMAYGVKIIPALLYRVKFTWRQALASGFLLSSRLSLIIAASAIALSIGAISAVVNADIILLAIITASISPFVFNRLYQPDIVTQRDGTIIYGDDQVAEVLARHLMARGEKVTVVCANPARQKEFERAEIPTISSNRHCLDDLQAADPYKAIALVDLTTSIEETLAVCTQARQRYGIPTVVSRISDVDLIRRLTDLGVKVVQPALATIMALEGALRFPTAFDVLMAQTDEVEVVEMVLTNRFLDNVPISRLNLPGNTLVLSIHRNQSVIVPQGDTRLRIGDHVGMIGDAESLSLTRMLLSL